MKSLSIALERLSFNLHQAKKGLITPTTRSRAATRRATRARLGLECLETRDLMSGMTLANPVSGATPAPNSQNPPLLLPPASLAATPVSPTQVDLAWQDIVGSAQQAFVYEQTGSGKWSTLATLNGDPKSYTVTGLNPDSAYNFYIYTYGTALTIFSGGFYYINSTSSNVASATTFLPLQGSPTLTATAASSTAVNLTWTPVSGVQQYTASWSQNPGGQVQSTLLSQSTLQWQVTGLSPYTSYNFQVTADDGVNTSSPSNVQTVTTLQTSPTVTATPSSTGIYLSWNNLPGSMDYMVYGMQNGTWQPIANVGTVTDYPYGGLTPYTTYDLKVGAVGPWGIAWSSPQNVTTLPPTVTLNATAVSASQANLTWNSAPGTTEYDVYCSQAGSPWDFCGSTTTGTSYSVPGLSSASNWSFKIGDVGPWGLNWSNVQTVLTFPVAPAISIAASSSTQVIIQNVYSGGATGYYIDEMVKGAWQQVANLSANTNISAGYTYDVNGLNPNTTYQFQVGAYNASGTSWTAAKTVTTFPAAPTVSASISSTQINFSWATVPGATAYGIDELEGGLWQQVASLGSTATSDSVTGLSPDTTYSFKFSASNSAGTSWTNSENVTTSPATPVFTLSAVSPTQVNVAWNSVPGASEYLIEVWTGGVLTQNIVVAPSPTSYAVTGLNPETNYQFQVFALSLLGTSAANTETITTPPAAPVVTLSASSAVQMNVAWNAVAGATSYLVEELEGSTWVQVGDVAATTTSLLVGSLLPNTSYEFRVAAVSPSGTTWSTAQTARTPALHFTPVPVVTVA